MESKTWVEHRKSLGCFSFVSRHGAASWGAGQEAGAAGPGLECMLLFSPLGMRRLQRRRGWVGPPRFLRHPAWGCAVCVCICECVQAVSVLVWAVPVCARAWMEVCIGVYALPSVRRCGQAHAVCICTRMCVCMSISWFAFPRAPLRQGFDCG